MGKRMNFEDLAARTCTAARAGSAWVACHEPRVVNPEPSEIAEMIDRVIAARPGPHSTFAEREVVVAATGGRAASGAAGWLRDRQSWRDRSDRCRGAGQHQRAAGAAGVLHRD